MLLAGSPVRAFCRATTEGLQPDPRVCPSGGVPVAWPGGCAGLSIDPRVLPPDFSRDQFRAQVTAAATRWAAADCMPGHPSFMLVEYPDCPHGAEYHRNGPNANTVSFRTHWGEDAFHPPDAIAVTITSFGPDTGDLRDADTELNLRSPTNPDGFEFTTGVPDPTRIDLPTILTHELGHSLGLAHSDDPSAVMWFAAGQGEQRRMLDPDDVAGVCAIYPPERDVTCDPTPRGGFECASGCHCRAGQPVSGGAGALLAAVLALLAGRRRRSSVR
jgi:MYXO-CTERM domain-containing protein